MKAKEIRDLTPEERNQKLVDLTEELFNLRFQHASGQLENPAKIGQAKRNIARLKTIIIERERDNA